ncbi:MAG: DUF1735 domain-containing protein, partial [Pedobacter sp.]
DNTVKGIVEFYNNTPITSGSSAIFPVYTPATLELTPTAEFDVTVNYASVDPAPEDITVQLSVASDAVTQYNTTHTANYNTLPAAAYTIPASVTQLDYLSILLKVCGR